MAVLTVDWRLSMTDLHFLFCYHRAVSTQGNSVCRKWKGAFPQDRDFEVRNFVKSYPLATRCVVFDNDCLLDLRKGLCFLSLYT